ncbi:hypothetical protein DY052_06315 [Apilactobacillus timberlakei]|uniref:hypothetical protein n=1 Tax=Apilactobacillus timberlakei TaxID=2008380 RepID=UPI00112D6453|nr:hypothetical protein [Apilactobacillus timberlakei]TPR15038.1 hypothetical protein DY052_06315 [Apilactobacillus timberlakei]
MGEYRKYRNDEKKIRNQEVYSITASYYFRNDNGFVSTMALIAPAPYKIFKWLFPIYAVYQFLMELGVSDVMNAIIFKAVIYFAVVIAKAIFCEKLLRAYNDDHEEELKYEQIL